MLYISFVKVKVKKKKEKSLSYTFIIIYFRILNFLQHQCRKRDILPLIQRHLRKPEPKK